MLRHSSDSEPGFTRRHADKGWSYFDLQGREIRDALIIDRLNRIALPPAYHDAWFCKDADGHIQATGIDARGRKQYRYHPDYRARRDERKFHHCGLFGNTLPDLRDQVASDLADLTLTRNTVVAAVVRLLDEDHIRIGNEQYARSNHHYGATTLRQRHLQTHGRDLGLRFTGKHGIVHEVSLTDSHLKQVVRRCQDLPGQHLFHYLDGQKHVHAVTSTDVNDYIRGATGADFTAKDFRTWGASVIFFDELLLAQGSGTVRLNAMLKPVAEALGNTPAISRKSYVHPALIEAVRDHPADPLDGMMRPPPRKGLSGAETGFLAFLRHHDAAPAIPTA